MKIILMHGPPGCGKHCTLEVIGGELGFVVESNSANENSQMRVITDNEYDQVNKEMLRINKLFSILSLANRELQ